MKGHLIFFYETVMNSTERNKLNKALQVIPLSARNLASAMVALGKEGRRDAPERREQLSILGGELSKELERLYEVSQQICKARNFVKDLTDGVPKSEGEIQQGRSGFHTVHPRHHKNPNPFGEVSKKLILTLPPHWYPNFFGRVEENVMKRFGMPIRMFNAAILLQAVHKGPNTPANVKTMIDDAHKAEKAYRGGAEISSNTLRKLNEAAAAAVASFLNFKGLYKTFGDASTFSNGSPFALDAFTFFMWMKDPEFRIDQTLFETAAGEYRATYEKLNIMNLEKLYNQQRKTVLDLAESKIGIQRIISSFIKAFPDKWVDVTCDGGNKRLINNAINAFTKKTDRV